MACGKELVCKLMEAGAGPPGIQHLERSDYADRIALLKSETKYLSGFLPAIGEGVGLVARVTMTGILLARVLLRQDPLLLLLDEPTSGLDPAAEQAVFESFSAAAAGAARRSGAVVVLVSHRFSTVRLADHIVVLAGGRVVEQGNHDQLVAAAGLYAELFGIQARAYR